MLWWPMHRKPPRGVVPTQESTSPGPVVASLGDEGCLNMFLQYRNKGSSGRRLCQKIAVALRISAPLPCCGRIEPPSALAWHPLQLFFFRSVHRMWSHCQYPLSCPAAKSAHSPAGSDQQTSVLARLNLPASSLVCLVLHGGGTGLAPHFLLERALRVRRARRHVHAYRGRARCHE